jgi:Skp family chaperone for outer membrane proteins
MIWLVVLYFVVLFIATQITKRAAEKYEEEMDKHYETIQKMIEEYSEKD